MSLKVIDGARFLGSSAADIPISNYANASTTNSASQDMSEFFELMAQLDVGVIVGTASVQFVVQESNESAANFTNISGATVTVVNSANSNLAKRISVNWKHPDRLRYARLQGLVTVANAAFFGATIARLQPRGGDMDIDDSVTEVK